jgi:hypothetical protein
MMNTAFKLTKASLVLAFALVGLAAKVVWGLLEIIFDAADSVDVSKRDDVGYRYEVGGDDKATHTFDGRPIVD